MITMFGLQRCGFFSGNENSYLPVINPVYPSISAILLDNNY